MRPTLHPCLVIIAALASLCILCEVQQVEAQPKGFKGGATIALETRYRQTIEDGATSERTRYASLGVNIRAMASKSWILYAAGFDYELGSSDEYGFLYQVNLYPVGVGTMLGPNAKIGLRAGIGMSGVLDEVQYSAQFPVELRFELDVYRKLRVVSFARAIWLTDNSRERGSMSTSLVDEVAGGIRLRWGKRYYPHDNRLSAGNGYFLGGLYQEQMGATLIGLTFGYSLNASFGRF